MSTPAPTTHVVILSSKPGAPARRLVVGADGRILARETLAAAPPHPPPHPPSARPSRVVLVVPGTEAPAQWLELPARNPLQARAAARALLQDRLAGDGGSIHLAVAPAGDVAAPRPVVAVADAAMEAWLGQAAGLGLRPDAMLPDHLALPPPADADAATVAVRDADWLVRTPTHSFRVEAPLAAVVLGPRAAERTDDPDRVEALLAQGALAAPLDLLQDRYAPTAARPAGARAWRRTAMLAALLLASPPLLWTAELARHAVAAQRLEARAQALAAAALGPAAADAPVDAAHDAWNRARASDGFARAAGALFAGLRALDGAAIERLQWSAGGPLRATLVHRDPAELDALAASVAGRGLALAPAGTRRTDGDLLTEIELLEDVR